MTHWKPKLAAAVSILLIAVIPSTAAPDAQQVGISIQDVLARTWAAYAALSSYSDEVKEVVIAHEKTSTWHATVKVARPNLYLVEWQRQLVTLPDSDPPTANGMLRFWSEGDGAAWAVGNKQEAQRIAKGDFLAFAPADLTHIPFAFFGRPLVCGTFSPECYRARYQMKPDEKINDVDCFVLLRGEQDQSIVTLWIGKNDFLLRQIRIVRPHNVMTQTHSNIVMNVPMSPSNFAPSPN